MEIKINIQKRYFWILALLLIGIALVIGQSTLTPQQFGHTANQIQVTYNGAQVTLQQALNTISGGSGGSSIVTGSYIGDGQASQFIEVSGINAEPTMVWVVSDESGTGASNTGAPPIYRIEDKNLHADTKGDDDNFKWTNLPPGTVGNNLLGAQNSGRIGFYVTNTNLVNGFTTNTDGFHYAYFVIASPA